MTTRFFRRIKSFPACLGERYNVATCVLQKKTWCRGIRLIIEIEGILEKLRPKKRSLLKKARRYNDNFFSHASRIINPTNDIDKTHIRPNKLVESS